MADMMRWYNIEINSELLKNDLTVFLKRSGIYYECSGCGRMCYHLEIKCTPDQADAINRFLDDAEMLDL